MATTFNAMWVVLAARVALWLHSRRKAERRVRWATGGLLAFFAIHLGLARPA